MEALREEYYYIMDDVQKIIVQALRNNRACLSDRTKLKGLLSDVLLNDKIHINLILSVYDVDYHYELVNSTDRMIQAHRFIKSLMKDYGVSEQNAKWSIVTWCYILEIPEVAEAIDDDYIDVSESTNDTNRDEGESKEYIVPQGMYRAGYDIPIGLLSITALFDGIPDANKPFILEIGDDPNTVGKGHRFEKGVQYRNVKCNHFLWLNYMGREEFTVSIKKVG